MEGAYKSRKRSDLLHDRARRNDFKLKEARFGVDVRQQFFTQRAVRCWHS